MKIALTPGNWSLTSSAGFNKPDGAIVPLLIVKLYCLVTPIGNGLASAHCAFEYRGPLIQKSIRITCIWDISIRVRELGCSIAPRGRIRSLSMQL